MRKLLVGIAAAAAVGGMAVAQAQVEVVLEPEVRTQIRDYVVVRAEPAVPVADFDVAVGTVVPETVELRAIEGVPAVAEYRYVAMQDRILLVDPRTRIIVSVIDAGETGEGTGAAGQNGTGQPGEAAAGTEAGEDDASEGEAEGEGDGAGAN